MREKSGSLPDLSYGELFNDKGASVNDSAGVLSQWTRLEKPRAAPTTRSRLVSGLLLDFNLVSPWLGNI